MRLSERRAALICDRVKGRHDGMKEAAAKWQVFIKCRFMQNITLETADYFLDNVRRYKMLLKHQYLK